MRRFKIKIRGSKDRPRLAVHRTNNHIYIQAIDDKVQKTIIGYSTLNLEIQKDGPNTDNCEAAYLVGLHFGKKLLENNINSGIFDRRNQRYHGRIKALANGIRKAGVKI